MSKYMRINLQEITKNVYFSQRSNGELLASRPCGFIKLNDGMRWLYITHTDSGKFYKGPLNFTQTNEMFMEMKFTDVQQFITAQFEAIIEEPPQAANAS